MKTKIAFLYVILLFSCTSPHVELKYYEGTDVVKEERIYRLENRGTHEYIGYYPNGQIQERGMIIDSKKEGTWERWYADGIFRGEIEYVTGEEDRWNEKRKIPILVFDTDSLVVGKKTQIKLIHVYPSDGLSCNYMFADLEDKSYYDFAVIPSGADSIRFFASCVWCPPAETDTVTVFKSDTDSLLKYGFTEEDFEEQESMTVVFNRVKTLELGAFPVYDK